MRKFTYTIKLQSFILKYAKHNISIFLTKS